MTMLGTWFVFVTVAILGTIALGDDVEMAQEGSSKVHAFYYLWYGSPQFNGEYKHWNHEVLPHWESRINSMYPQIGSRFSPPANLHSPFYPSLGAYSSSDPKALREHFRQLTTAQVFVIAVSWWGPRHKAYATDTQGVNTDETLQRVLEFTEEYNAQHPYQPPLQIALHLEPYPTRSIESVREDIEYIQKTYSRFRCLLRVRSPRVDKGFSDREKILFYVYDSYHIEPNQWQRLLYNEGDLSIRTNEDLDGVFLGLWLQPQHGRDLFHAGFDGIYTYFASDGFTHGASSSQWTQMCGFCHSRRMLCDISVGPGYNDSLIRPWNGHNTKDRKSGQYYRNLWQRAIDAKPDFISITSFNEWGEGTQIEAAQRATLNGRTYQDYGSNPFLYLNITHEFVNKYHAKTRLHDGKEL